MSTPICPHSDTLLLATNRGTKLILLQRLVRIEALSNYSKLCFSDGKSLVVARVLRRFEAELLASGFLRIHHKHLVNLQWLENRCESGESLLLRNGEKLTASRRKKRAVQDALVKWLCKKSVAAPLLTYRT